MIVPDASVVVEALVGNGDLGDRTRRRLAAAPQCHAPELIYVEVANALCRLAAAGLIATELADRAVNQLARLDITAYPHAPLLRRILGAASQPDGTRRCVCRRGRGSRGPPPHPRRTACQRTGRLRCRRRRVTALRS